jgi:hypothetical protein
LISKKLSKGSVTWSLLWLSILLLWSILIIPYVIVSLAFGYYLMQTKLLTLPFYERLWHDLLFSSPFTLDNLIPEIAGSPKIEEKILNLQMLNRAVLTEIWCEAIPQIIVQSVNNVRMKSFGLIPKISLVSSILLIVNSYYRIFYFNLVHRIPLSEIPARLKTPLSPLVTIKTKFQKLSTTVKHQTNSLFFHPTDREGEELNQQEMSSSSSSSSKNSVPCSPILVSFQKGETGIVLKKSLVYLSAEEVSSEEVSSEEVSEEETSSQMKKRKKQQGRIGEMPSVFLINEDCQSYLLGVRRGYVVESVNGLPYSTTSQVIFGSNHCGEPCEVIFRPPRNPYVIVRLESQIQTFKDIGLVVSHHRSCFLDVGYFQVDSVDSSSICYNSGVRDGSRIMSVNGKCFIPRMRIELFSHPDDCDCDWLERLLSFSFKSCEKGSSHSPLIVFKNHQSGTSWLDVWSTDQEILNNHLRSVLFLIVTSKNGVPYFGRIPLFFTEVLDNFPTLCLFVFAWILVITLQLCWIMLWTGFYSLIIPLMLPWTLLKSLYQLKWPFQLSRYVFVILSILLVSSLTYLISRTSFYVPKVWYYWIAIHGLFILTSSLGGLVFQPYTGLYLFFLWAVDLLFGLESTSFVIDYSNHVHNQMISFLVQHWVRNLMFATAIAVFGLLIVIKIYRSRSTYISELNTTAAELLVV